MKRLLALFLSLVLIAVFGASVQAGTSVDGASLDSGITVENVPPEIDDASLLVQIVDEGGVAWGWQSGNK